jgi:hypothetical protein
MFGVKREIRRTVFFASAVPSTYSGNSMATPSFGYGAKGIRVRTCVDDRRRGGVTRMQAFMRNCRNQSL